MIKCLLLVLLASVAVCSSGCTFFKKSDRPKESSAIASEVEESFRRRWLEKRLGELAAQGVEASAARAQAEAEFRERYGFTADRK